ncbi:MAG: hypothetical protein AB7S55_05995 [Thiomonas sp.]|jgi:hypothetical protein
MSHFRFFPGCVAAFFGIFQPAGAAVLLHSAVLTPADVPRGGSIVVRDASFVTPQASAAIAPHTLTPQERELLRQQIQRLAPDAGAQPRPAAAARARR